MDYDSAQLNTETLKLRKFVRGMLKEKGEKPIFDPDRVKLRITDGHCHLFVRYCIAGKPELGFRCYFVTLK